MQARRTRHRRIQQGLIRSAVAGYFFAAGLGIAADPPLLPLAARILPGIAADAFAAVVTVTLALVILVGLHARAAALGLALLTFWSGYVTLQDLGVADDLSPAWRAMALLGALFLAGLRARENHRDAPANIPGVVGRLNRIARRPVRNADPNPVWRPARSEADDEITNIFAQAT